MSVVKVDKPELLVTASIPWDGAEFALVRAYFDGKTVSGDWLLTPDEARTLGTILELGAREAGVRFEYVEEVYRET